MTTDRRTPKPIPAFASREAEAEFWDTHDVIDYAISDTPIRLNFGPGGEKVELFIETETLDLSRAIAAEMGVPWEGLLELWLVERRDAERERRAAEAVAQKRESA